MAMEGVKDIKSRTFIGCFQVTLWQWKGLRISNLELSLVVFKLHYGNGRGKGYQISNFHWLFSSYIMAMEGVKDIKSRTFIGCFQVTLWQWKELRISNLELSLVVFKLHYGNGRGKGYQISNFHWLFSSYIMAMEGVKDIKSRTFFGCFQVTSWHTKG